MIVLEGNNDLLRECDIAKRINTHINYSIPDTRNGFASSELWQLFLCLLDRDSNTIFHSRIYVQS